VNQVIALVFLILASPLVALLLYKMDVIVRVILLAILITVLELQDHAHPIKQLLQA